MSRLATPGHCDVVPSPASGPKGRQCASLRAVAVSSAGDSEPVCDGERSGRCPCSTRVPQAWPDAKASRIKLVTLRRLRPLGMCPQGMGPPLSQSKSSLQYKTWLDGVKPHERHPGARSVTGRRPGRPPLLTLGICTLTLDLRRQSSTSLGLQRRPAWATCSRRGSGRERGGMQRVAVRASDPTAAEPTPFEPRRTHACGAGRPIPVGVVVGSGRDAGLLRARW